MVDDVRRGRGVGRLADRLLHKGAKPVEQQRPIVGSRIAHPSGNRDRRLDAVEREDALSAVRTQCRTRCRRPGLRERFRLRLRRDQAGRVIVDRFGKRLEHRVVARPGHDEVVRRRSERGADCLPAVLGQPEPVLGVVRRMVPQRSGDSEDQVVARLVGQEKRRSCLEEGGRIFDAANVHTKIVGTRTTTIRPPVILDRTIARMLPAVPKPLVHMLAQRYIAGPTLDDACRVVRAANAQHKLATIDVLGEEVARDDEARAIAGAYRDVFETIERQELDSNVSVKLTGLGLKLDYGLCRENLESVVDEAARRNNFVRIDMEDSSTTDDTLRLYRELREAGHENVGVVLQAYLRRTIDDIRSLADLRPSVRICKGIYVEPPELAYQGYEEVRANFVRALEALLDAGCYVGIATHDEWLIDEGRRIVARRGLGRDDYEFQMLYGVAEPLGNRLVAEGHRLRVYVPFGEHWYAYSLRRLQENPKIAGYIAADTLGRLVPRRNGSA